MEYIHAFFDFVEQVMGIGLVVLIALSFLSMFGKSGEDRYNGAGTLDH